MSFISKINAANVVTDVESVAGIVRGYCTSGKFPSLIAKMKSEVLKEIHHEMGLSPKDSVRREHDGVSELDILVEKMFGEYLINQKIEL